MAFVEIFGWLVDQTLHEPLRIFRGRNTAGIGFPHPLIAVTGNKTVNGVTNGPRNEDADIQERPKPVQGSKDFKGRRGFREHFPILYQKKRFILLSRELKLVKNVLGWLGLKHAEFK